MAVFDLFSKRQKILRGGIPDIYTYDNIPNHFRVQVIHIIRDAIGESSQYHGKEASIIYEFLHQTLCREYGVFSLKNHPHSDEEAIFDYMLNTDNYEHVLDIIELSFKCINTVARDSSYQDNIHPKIKPNDAIEELNIRFKEHAIGYQFESNELIRIDSTFIHSDITKPVLSLLRDKHYKGANEEFLKAHEHYRHGRNKECLNDCLKSFESVLKSICSKHKWSFSPNDTSKKLIEICLTNDLIPSYLQNQFTSIRFLLESGIPTIRNRLGGHGQGAVPIDVDDYIASYALHLTASNIFFLINCEKYVK